MGMAMNMEQGLKHGIESASAEDNICITLKKAKHCQPQEVSAAIASNLKL